MYTTCDNSTQLRGHKAGDRLFTIRDAAAVLAASTEFLNRLHRCGGLDVVRLGKAVRVPQTEVDRLIREGVPRAAAR